MLAAFRCGLCRWFTKRADALSGRAVRCQQGRVQVPSELPLGPEHRRSHGTRYGALSCGNVRVGRLRWALAAMTVPVWDDGRIRLAVGCD